MLIAEMMGDRIVVKRTRVTGRHEQMMPTQGSTNANVAAEVSIPKTMISHCFDWV